MGKNGAANRLTSSLAIIFLLFAFANQIEATLFILGNACLIAIKTIDAFAGAQLESANLDQPLETVSEFCRLATRYSIEGVLLEDILPQLRQLIRLAGSGNLSLEPAGELAQLLRGLAQSIEVSGALEIG